MRLLLVNPNTTEAMTERMEAVARAAVGDGVEIVARTAPRGFPYIASRAEAQMAGAIALETVAEAVEGCDAVIVAAFGDPGLAAARELFDVPVVGMAQAACLTATMLGETFGIVTFTPLMTRWYADCVRATGLRDRFTGIRTPEGRDAAVPALDDLRAPLTSLARRAALEDGADVVILGGAPLAGLAPEIAGDVPAVLVDPIAAAAVQAMGLARQRPNLARRPFPPAAKTSQGLAPALAAAVARGRAGGA